LIVRLAFLKYPEYDIDNLHRALEKLIKEKIEPTTEAKKKKKDISFSSGVKKLFCSYLQSILFDLGTSKQKAY
jgi:hypothetical protein